MLSVSSLGDIKLKLLCSEVIIKSFNCFIRTDADVSSQESKKADSTAPKVPEVPGW